MGGEEWKGERLSKTGANGGNQPCLKQSTTKKQKGKKINQNPDFVFYYLRHIAAIVNKKPVTPFKDCMHLMTL